MLKVSRISVSYGNVAALRDASISVRSGELVGILGMNGSGKTTLGEVIAGAIRPNGGSILIETDEARIDLLKDDPIRRLRRGIVFVPQGDSTFDSLSVRENLNVAFASGGVPRLQREAHLHRVTRLFPLFGRRYEQKAGSLSGGEKKLLSVARALLLLSSFESASGSRAPQFPLLVVDEPSHGLHPNALTVLGELLREITKDGVSILLLDQVSAFVLRVTERVYVMRHGRTVASGTACELRQREDIPEINCCQRFQAYHD